MARAELAKSKPEPKKRFTLQYPAGWDSLTPEQKMAAAMGMAAEIRKQMGVTD